VTRCLPPRQTRRCRRRFRTTTIGRTRTPSIGLVPSLATRAGSTSLVVHARSLTPHPVARREPRHRPGPKPRRAALPASSKAGGVASSYLVASRGPPYRCRHFRPRDAARKMRLTDFCNRLPSRAPTDCPIPGCSRAAPRLATCDGARAGSPWAETPRRWAGNPPIRLPNEPPGRASLDGEPPASTIVAEQTR